MRVALADHLKQEDYDVSVAADGEAGYQEAISERYDLLILDLMLPRKKGFDVSRDIRKAGFEMPIIMLTARSDTIDKVLGLKLGADDYDTKPFEMVELLARVEAQLRRPAIQPHANTDVLNFGSVRVNLEGTSVTKKGKTVPLSAREFQLLRYFVQHPGMTLSREVLLKEVWGYNSSAFSRTVDVHVASLRQKLEQDPRRPTFFVTVIGLV